MRSDSDIKTGVITELRRVPDLMTSTSMPIGEIAMRKPICVDLNTSALAATELMRIYQVAELVVTDQADGSLVPVGILSARDIVTRIIATGLDPAVVTAGDITWSESIGAKVTDSVSDTLQLLQATKGNVLPVLDASGSLTAVVTLHDLLWVLAAAKLAPTTGTVNSAR